MKKKIFSLIMAACVVMTAGCGGNASTQTAESTDTQTVSSIADRDTLNIVLADEIVSLDPAYSYDNLTNQVVNQITQGLLYFDYSGQLQPQLCSSWEAVDSTTYVYQIRDDVCFSDGSPMTMEDVLFSLNRHMDEDVASYLAWMYANVDSI